MKKFHRDDLYVQWSVTGDDPINVLGLIWLKTDDPEVRPNRLKVALILSPELYDSESQSLIIPIAEERLQLDLNEINGEGSFTEENAKHPDVMALRGLLEAP